MDGGGVSKPWKAPGEYGEPKQSRLDLVGRGGGGRAGGGGDGSGRRGGSCGRGSFGGTGGRHGRRVGALGGGLSGRGWTSGVASWSGA